MYKYYIENVISKSSHIRPMCMIWHIYLEKSDHPADIRWGSLVISGQIVDIACYRRDVVLSWDRDTPMQTSPCSRTIILAFLLLFLRERYPHAGRDDGFFQRLRFRNARGNLIEIPDSTRGYLSGIPEVTSHEYQMLTYGETKVNLEIAWLLSQKPKRNCV